MVWKARLPMPSEFKQLEYYKKNNELKRTRTLLRYVYTGVCVCSCVLWGCVHNFNCELCVKEGRGGGGGGGGGGGVGDHIVVMLCHTSPTYSVCLITIPSETDFQLDSEPTIYLGSHSPTPPLFVLLPRRAPT